MHLFYVFGENLHITQISNKYFSLENGKQIEKPKYRIGLCVSFCKKNYTSDWHNLPENIQGFKLYLNKYLTDNIHIKIDKVEMKITIKESKFQLIGKLPKYILDNIAEALLNEYYYKIKLKQL